MTTWSLLLFLTQIQRLSLNTLAPSPETETETETLFSQLTKSSYGTYTHDLVAFHAPSDDQPAVRETTTGGWEGSAPTFTMVKKRSRGPPKLPSKQLAILGKLWIWF
jgi:hypothetical protein